MSGHYPGEFIYVLTRFFLMDSSVSKEANTNEININAETGSCAFLQGNQSPCKNAAKSEHVLK